MTLAVERVIFQIWSAKPETKKRMSHARRAMQELQGWVDVVLLSGEPGVSYEDAQIWVPSERGAKRWRVVFLDETTGHVRLEAQ